MKKHHSGQEKNNKTANVADIIHEINRKKNA